MKQLFQSPKLFLTLSALVITLLAGCNALPVSTSQTNEALATAVAKSPNDQRDYRAIVLDNNLQVMLISDPQTDKSAASMDVYVGSANDPEEFPGLAHFLEHMLFLGTEKYPDADAYQKYISDHGGRHNAFTSAEHTNYFFEVSSEHLAGALDRFSQQFTAPLFNADYVEREVNAVHSEYSSKLKDDGRRFFSAIKQTLANDHPYRKFAVGNLATLKDRDDKKLREALLDFYAKHYSANVMKLVILGKESLDELEKLAQEKFNGIVNRQLEHKPVNQPFFEEGFLPAQLSVQSIKDTRSMMVAFPIPSPTEYVHSQPVSYLANLIGHEGQGSLLSALKQAQLVDSLSAGAQFDTRNQAIFMINMSLTQNGLDNPDEILEYLFSYIDLVQLKGLKKTYFDEQAKMLDISFRFQEKLAPFSYVRALAGALQDTSPEEVLVEGYQLTNYDEELYGAYVKHLTPENMLITLSANTFEGKQSTRWFKTPYTIEPFSAERLARLDKREPKPELALPEKNRFIPDDVKLLSQNDSKIPELTYQNEGIQLWHSVDTTFGTPKSNLFVTLRSPAAMQSATSLNQIELMVSLFKDALNEFSYPAYLGGLNYELYNHMRGVTIKISGYSDKQSLLLEEILSSIQFKPFMAERFVIIKERLERTLRNLKARKPYEQALGAAQRHLMHPSWSTDERIEALAGINLQSMESFRKEFFRALDIALLSNGNTPKAKAIKIAKMIENELLNKAERVSVKRAKVLKLEAEHLFDTVEVEHPDTGFVFYLQGMDRSFGERARFMLLSQLLGSDYYNDIRTEKQLGYIVFATQFPLLDVPGMGFIVQSPVASGQQLLDETKLFIKNSKQRLEALDDEQIERSKASVISRLTKKDNTLYEKSNRYWQEVDRENAAFDTRDQLAATLNQLNKADIVAALERIASNKDGRMLIYTHNGKDIETPEHYTDTTTAGNRQYFAD